MARLSELTQRYEEQSALKDFFRYAGCKMARMTAFDAEEAGMPPRVVLALKATVAGGVSSNTGLSAYGAMVGAFMDSLRNVGAFDRLAADALQLQNFVGRVVINSGTITASATAEGAAKAVRGVSLFASDIAPLKVTSMIVLSELLIDGLTPAGLAALEREMRSAVAAGTDVEAMSVLSAINAGDANSTNSWDSMLGDLEELLHQVNITAASKPYFITTAPVAKALSRAAYANGITTMNALGGSIMGVPVLVSDGQGTQKVTLCDATGLAVISEPVSLRASRDATIEMSDAPSGSSSSPSAVQMISLFQDNCRGLLCERAFAVKVIRPSAVATLTNVGWGISSDSPAGF